MLCAAGGKAGAPGLLALGAYDAEAEGEDPLRLRPHPLQFHGEAPPPEAVLRENWDEVITRRIFGQDHPPRWLLVLSFSRVLLIERGKWTHNRLLRFDLDEILGRREDATLKAAAALLHRDCLLPPDGRSLLDSLDENSHKHAFAVSEDLKYALRESIELIGNEAICYLREVLKDKVYDRTDDALAGQLGRECLRYMYRLLFLFYIEARPDLGYAPMDSETYLKGYSLEHLRDLELVRLTSEESLDGYYLHHAVQTLFGLIRDGFDGSQRGGAADLLASEPGTHLHHGFRIRALDSALFREGSTPLLDRVKLRNHVLQRGDLPHVAQPPRQGPARAARAHLVRPARHQPARRRLRSAALVPRLLRRGEPLRGEEGGRTRRPPEECLVRAGARPRRLYGRRTRSTTRTTRAAESSASIRGAVSSTVSPAATGRRPRATTRRSR